MKKVVSFIFFIYVFFGCDESKEPVDLGPVIEAEAELFSLSSNGDDTYELLETKIGTASFTQQAGVVTIAVSLTGMTPNSSKAVHIHSGDVNDPGRHWNRGSFYASCNEWSLGSAWSRPFAGDVGNVVIDENGNGTFTLQTDMWALNSGDEKEILDLPIIVHNDPEDFVLECDPKHSHDHLHSNIKIAGGTIKMTTDVQQLARTATMTLYPDFTICN